MVVVASAVEAFTSW